MYPNLPSWQQGQQPAAGHPGGSGGGASGYNNQMQPYNPSQQQGYGQPSQSNYQPQQQQQPQPNQGQAIQPYGTYAGGQPGSSSTHSGIQPGQMIQSNQPGQLSNTQNITGYRPGYYAPSGPQTSLQPQSLENVNKDEDPVYGPLGRAKGRVERALVGDTEISPDLGDILNVPTNEPYVALPGPAFQPMKILRTTPLPDALHQELNFKHLTAKMGLFEEIERAWFTVDNKLFLWDYSDGRDFNRYDEQADTIQAVGLVRARKDVFVDEVTHLLIICTSSKLTLLGVSHPSPRELNLYATNLTAELPTPMTYISGTAAGRIFMLGQNKELYELEYSTATGGGWFFGGSTRVGVYNRTSGSLSNWVPSIFASSSKEGVESFTVDAQQGRLFTLHTKGEIEYYDVSGNNFNLRGKYTRLRNDLINRGVAGQGPAHAGANVVSIAAVGRHESQRVCLVAVTANGTRAYFSSTTFTYSPIIRPPPGNVNLNPQSLYASGTLLGVQDESSGPTPSAKIHFITPHSGRQAAARENYDVYEAPMLQEWISTENIPSQVWTIAEVPSTSPANSPSSLRRSDGVALSPLPRQALAEARQFLILATSGLFFVSMPRPIDLLQSDLEVEKDAAIITVRNTFGKTQLAAMGITMGSTGDLRQADLASAVSTILLSAGTPLIRDGTTGKTIVYSSRHDGLAACIARILRGIWNVKVTAPALGGRQVLGVSERELLSVQGRLEGLRRYIQNHPFPRHQADGDAKIAWDQEELSLHGLTVLLKQATEAISFVLLLSDYKLGDIVAKCDPQVQGTLANLTFQGLFTNQDGRDLARKLVTALIEQQIGQELGIDTLSEILQQRCGTFCQPGDVVLYKAEESMRRAESARDAAERSDMLGESLRLFTKAAASIPISRLQDVSKRYRDLQYIVGAIELPLKCANDLDPNDKAQDYVQDGKHPSDPRQALYTARMECYSCVIQALGMFDDLLNSAIERGNAGPAQAKHDEAYALAIASDDELFHFYLYDWHVARHLSEQLLDFETPYIEKYLQQTANTMEERRDLLWKFYARREDYLPAAKALFELATRQSPMTLNERVYYLAQALTNAKSAATLGAEDVEFTSNLQERMDVANVQMEVAKAVESHTEMSDTEKGQAMGALNSDLQGLNELYQNFARPFRLYEPILLILKTADTRLDDVIEAVWRELLRSSMIRGPAEAAMSETTTELCRRYFPSEAAPLDIVLAVVYSEASQIGGSPGWASEALHSGGIPLRDLWEGVMALYEEDGESEYYAEEAAKISGYWIKDKSSIPAAEVERFATAHLLQSTALANDERRRETRDKFQKAKSAAARY